MNRAGYAFSEAEKKEGWPDRMDARKLAALQRPAYYTLIKRMMEHDPYDPVALAQIEQTSANRSLHEILQHEFNAGRGPDTREKFAAWLLTQGVAPSQDSQAWFASVSMIGIVKDREQSQKEDRQAERLARLRELGGDRVFDKRKKTWKTTGQGAFTKLIKELGEKGIKPCTEKSIRADLTAAAEREKESGKAGYWDGLPIR